MVSSHRGQEVSLRRPRCASLYPTRLVFYFFGCRGRVLARPMILRESDLPNEGDIHYGPDAQSSGMEPYGDGVNLYATLIGNSWPGQPRQNNGDNLNILTWQICKERPFVWHCATIAGKPISYRRRAGMGLMDWQYGTYSTRRCQAASIACCPMTSPSGVPME